MQHQPDNAHQSVESINIYIEKTQKLLKESKHNYPVIAAEAKLNISIVEKIGAGIYPSVSEKHYNKINDAMNRLHNAPYATNIEIDAKRSTRYLETIYEVYGTLSIEEKQFVSEFIVFLKGKR